MPERGEMEVDFFQNENLSAFAFVSTENKYSKFKRNVYMNFLYYGIVI